MSVLELNEQNFNETIENSQVPILVDFWAPWCGPCKMLAPILEDTAKSIGDEAVIAKINVDNAQNLASQFGVFSIPTMIIFKDGKEVERMVGLSTKEKIITAIKGVNVN